jgi:hypothetical protein
MRDAMGKNRMDELRERRSRLASTARAQRDRELYGQRMATSLAPAVGRDVALSDFDINIEPPIDRNFTKSLNKSSERIAHSLTRERASEIAECLEGSLTSFEGLVGIYANDYLGLCRVARVSLRGMVEASEVVEDSVIFYPSEFRGAVVIDCYKSPPGHPPFGVYIVGKDLAERIAHCL